MKQYTTWLLICRICLEVVISVLQPTQINVYTSDILAASGSWGTAASRASFALTCIATIYE